jgi:hypothetical protein
MEGFQEEEGQAEVVFRGDRVLVADGSGTLAPRGS